MSRKMPGTVSAAEAEPALVPKLRFPEFRGASGWAPKRLGSVGQLTRGLTYSADDVAPAGLLVLRSTNIQDGSLVLDQDLVFVGKPCPEALRLQTGDIVICMSNGSKALVGKSGEYSGEYEGDITVGAFCSFFRPEFPFAKIAFHLNSYQRYIADLIAGGNINNLTNSVLEEFSFPVPSLLAEQQKIADCLSSLDELIATQARKVDVLKTHKKGLMRQLFPREGETQPRLRFPEFQNAGDWEAKTLKSFCKVGDIDHRMPSSVVDGVPYIMTGDFFGINQINFDGAKKVSNEDYEKLSKKIKVEFGDVIVARYASVGAVRYIETDVKFLVSYSCAIIKCGKSENSRYLYYIFQSDFIQSKIGLEINTGSQKNIGIESIKNLNISLPTLPEQQKIADCFVYLDALLTAATQKLEVLKTHKKGLMQQLFPSPEAVEA